MTLADYSVWLTPERLAVEEALWGGEGQTWHYFVDAINRVRKMTRIDSIIEFGCGTGWVPLHLPEEIHYVGVDANPGCIQRASRRNMGPAERWFDLRDVREYGTEGYDLACAFSFLKHFGLHEWDDIVRRVLRSGRWGLFSMPVGFETLDDGERFPHVWVTYERLKAAVQAAGHEVVSMETFATGETMVVTKVDSGSK